ncbi:MAG: hypothetical protein QXJ96_01020 [Candidatus Aenigmatarchaeota archaeon]|nr:hypothetical protein [Candidatus Aenigmarchaeota archaeon]
MGSTTKRYENLESLLDEVDEKHLPDIVLQLLSEGKDVGKSYVIDAIRVLERERNFKKAGIIAERAGLYEIASRAYQKANRKEDVERVRKLLYSKI